jgi:hypothetical protein
MSHQGLKEKTYRKRVLLLLLVNDRQGKIETVSM